MLVVVPSVHPRVGGEQSAGARPAARFSGSSPRGRGTGDPAFKATGLYRFIPAWAGNRPRPTSGSPCKPVHPRVGGEQRAPLLNSNGVSGSSPRGRGTARPNQALLRVFRFIPAWAGNSRWRNTSLMHWSVHPRVGGEQLDW